MPNGRESPHCVLCKNYVDNEIRRCCLKHDFILPKIGYNILCKDFCHKKTNSAIDIAEELCVNYLYYYYDNIYEKLEIFCNLQQLVLGGWIRKIDSQCEVIGNSASNIITNKYCIEIHDYDKRYFPKLGSEIFLKADGLSFSVEVCEAMFFTKNKFRRNYVMISRQADDIYKWLSCHFNIPYIIQKINADSFLSMDTEFPVFLKQVEIKNRFALMPDYLHFKLLFGLASIIGCAER